MEPKIKTPQTLERAQFIRLPTHEREQYMREILRKTLKMNPHGLTISKINQHLGIDPRTISKHLSVMEYTNEIYSEKFGRTSVYYPNTRLMHPASEQAFDLGQIEFQVYIIRNNRLGDSIFIQEKKKGEYVDDVGSGIMIPISKFKEFTLYLDKIARTV